MKTLLRILLVVGVLVGLAVPAYYGGTMYWKIVTRTKWRTVEVEKGGIVAVVNSTGTVKPKMQVTIGSFVSGPLLPEFTKPEEIDAEEDQATAWENDNAEWMAMLPENERVDPHDYMRVGVQLPDFNDDVHVEMLLAKIDPLLYWANVNRDAAALQNRIADVQRAKAVLQQAINDERRALDLRAEDKTFIAQAEMDKFRFNRMSLDAQAKVSETAVRQALAAVKNSLANLKYTRILSPVAGTIIHRKIEPGQTLASQFQSPELFIIGVDMREEMQIHASVDEADIGRIKEAQNKKLPVSFTVDAHEELFHGAIDQIRMNATTTQNVVTYPVVVKTANPDLKLLPSMTAAISFQVDERKDVVKIPNAALRFYPSPKQVRKVDVPIL